MASAFSHAFLALALGKVPRHPLFTRPVLFLGMACSIIPDLDVIGFSFWIQYGDLWGHRGMTHSLFFASLLSAVLTSVWYRQKSTAIQVSLFFYLFLCTASHGVLDALTDGGLGVAFFSPFDTSRYFFRGPTGCRLSDRHQCIFQRGCFSCIYQRSEVDLAPNHCGVLDRSRATICAVSSTDGEASAWRLTSILEKLTGYFTNVPLRMIGCLPVHREQGPGPIYLHPFATLLLARQAYTATAVILDIDRTGRPQTALPRAFYF